MYFIKGVTYGDIETMSRKKFMWLHKRLKKQKDMEEKEMQKSMKKARSTPKGKMKYLGR